MTAKKLVFLESIHNNRYLKYSLPAIFVLAVALGIVMVVHRSSRSLKESHPTFNKAQIQQGTESLDQLNPSQSSTGLVKVVFDLPVKQPVVFITIDDGWYPNENVITLMQKYHLPITTFPTELAVQKHPAFWHEFVSAGGHLEDHTVSHPFLTHLTLGDEKSQISQPIDYLRQYGPPPDELRPPYGNFNSEVEQAARDSGIKYIVMWNAEMENSKLYTIHNRELKSGDIILLHWDPDLDQEMLKLLSILQKQNLGVADLTKALNGEPVTESWLKLPLPAPKSFLAAKSYKKKRTSSRTKGHYT